MAGHVNLWRHRRSAAQFLVAGLGMAILCGALLPKAAAEESKGILARVKRLVSFEKSAKSDVQIIWRGGDTIRPGLVFNVSFPAAMVPTADIGVEKKPCPIRIKPELAGQWIWKSQTEGIFTVGETVRPNENYKLTLVGGLKDLQGNAVAADKPLAERKSPDFTISASLQAGPQDKRPSGGLSFSYPVSPSAVAETTWFQDRDNRQRYPVDVVVSDPDPKKPVTYASVSPREDLPKGRTFDLIVEGITETGTGYRLPEVFVQPLGTTEPLRVLKIAAYNRPKEKPGIQIDFNDQVEPTEGSKIRIEPKVEGVKYLSGQRALLLEGPFDTRLRYKVTVPAEVVGSHGYAMASESHWGATFYRKQPTIYFPSFDVNRRSKLGLRVPLIQVNTGPLQWRLARVPPEKLHAVQSRLREFTQIARDPLTGNQVIDHETDIPVWKPTELLVGGSHLETLAQGTIEASPEDADTRREITWTPSDNMAAGPCVLEVTGTNAEGKTIGNRTLVSFTEVGVLQKEFGGKFTLRVTSLADGHPLEGVKVRAVTDKNWWRADGTTDAHGVVEFSRTDLFPPGAHYDYQTRWFLLDTPEGLMFQPARGNGYYARDEEEEASYAAGNYRSSVVTDRPIYRPGHTVKFKGIFRVIGEEESLQIPAGKAVSWGFYRVRDEDDARDAVATGTATLDEFGGFEGEWKIPTSAPVNRYRLRVQWNGSDIGSTTLNVQEFRPPPFNVVLAEAAQSGEEAGLSIKSNYFHGAANAGARVKWTAVWRRLLPKPLGWRENSEWVLADIPRVISGRENEHKATGEGVLGLDGTLELKVKQPFTDGFLRGWYTVEWTVDVTGNDGQTITEPAETAVYAVPVVLGITGHEVPGPAKQIAIEANAYGPDENPADGTPVKVEVFQIVNKSVKEQIAPHVFRYQNTTSYEKVQALDGVTPFKQSVPVKDPGEYFIGVRHAENAAIPTSLRRVSVSGNLEDRPAEFAQENEAKFEVKSDKETYVVGEKAVLQVQAPFAGAAWISVEAGGKVLDAFEYRMESNAGRIDLPLKKEYFPNVWVNIYLMRPGGADRVPAERFGSVKLVIQRPELDLKVEPVLASKEARPGTPVSGEIGVTSIGQPVAGADVTAYAVDESFLVAGGWRAPEFLKVFYPQRGWNVSSFFSGLDQLAQKIAENDLTQKGFIIGGGGDTDSPLGPKKPIRKEFLPLAWWQTGLRTDANGKVAFSFKAPDSLTRYRVIALVQTKESQFGYGSDAVEISKPVQIEPALPRFIRVGDSLELRAIVRQKLADTLPVTLRCSSGLTMEGEANQTQTVKRGVPAVFRFRARVGDITSAQVHWETDAGPGDAVEMTIPVHPPTLLRKEAVFATLGKTNPLEDLHKLTPARWSSAVGKADVLLSTSPWLPKITGLPLLLEYPHGCFEQISSRVLGYTALGDLLAYLPDGGAHDQEYRKRVDDGLQRMNAALKPGGYLPYWPSDRDPSPFPTIAGYWAARCAKANGWEVPTRLLEEMPKAVRTIAEGKGPCGNTPFMRCFALMVLSEEGKDVQTMEPILRDIYLRREKYDEESRSLLAIAMHRFGVLPQEKEQLLREIDRPLPELEFDPDTFSSTTRTEAMRALAFATVHPEDNEGKTRQELKKRIGEMLETSRSLSTQENFWLLFAFKTMHVQAQSTPVDFGTAAPVPTEVSRNKLSAAWTGQDIRKVREFTPTLGGSNASLGGLSCLMDAQFRMESIDLEKDNRTDRGFRVERVVKNTTDPARTGEASAPYKLGDQLLITIRLISPKRHHYVAVEGELPGCLETINPNIESVARSFSIPREEGDRQLALSYSELRDKTTCLYFNRVDPGVAVYSVLARVTSAGSFRWPATQAVPMYDARFSGVSAASEVNAVGE